MSKLAWTIFAIISVGILGFFVFVSNSSKIDVSNLNANSIQAASKDNGNIGDSVFGNKKSKVVIVEYADYQCPGCAGFAPILKAAIADYENDVVFIFRSFPLSYHANSKIASASALAAGLQGKYWEMHYKIYESQQDWTNLGIDTRADFFVNLAKDLDLDIKKFKKDVASDEVSKKIAFDQAIASKVGVKETPTLFINGKNVDIQKLDGVDELKKLIKAAIK